MHPRSGFTLWKWGRQMAQVKTFRINPEYGVPDKDIREWLNHCEKEAILSVTCVFIPPVGDADPRLTVIAIKLDDLPQGYSVNDKT